MKIKYIFLLPIMVLIINCNQKPKQNSLQSEVRTIQNLNGKEISVDSINSYVKYKMAEMNIPGVSYAIINNGKVVLHNLVGYSNIDDSTLVKNETLFEGASTSKPVFASLVMLLVEDEILDLDTPLYKYLDENDRKNFNYDSRYEKITARMVLAHTTGFPNWRGDNELTISFEPGTNFGYSGEGYQFLVKAIESILKTDYQGLENYFHKKIAEQLGMTHTKFVQDEYNRNNKAYPHFNGVKKEKNEWTAGEFSAASSLHTESKEFAKWLIAIMKGSLLSKNSSIALLKEEINMSTAPAILSEEGAIAWTLGFAKYNISDYVVLGHEGNNDGFNALFLFDKDKKWGMIQFNNANEVYDFGFDLFRYINKNN